MHELELFFLEALQKSPNLAKELESDYDYQIENAFVHSISKILVSREFDDELLASASKGGYMVSKDSLAFENCEDYVLQAVLSSAATPSRVLDTIIHQNPDWLDGGWWCLQRLAQNPNTSSQLLLEAAKRADKDDLDEEIVNSILNHPNLTGEIADLFDN